MKIRKSVYLLLVIFIAGFIRILYSSYVPNPVVMEDTHAYYGAGQRMIESKMFVDDSRPPVYPLFLQLPFIALGKFQAPILSLEFFQGANIIVLIQTLLGVLGLAMLYYLLILLKVKPHLSFLLVLFLALDIHYFAAERVLLTESLSASLVILTLLLIVRILHSPRLYLFIPLTFLFLLLLLLKPGFITLPFVALIIAWYHRHRTLYILASLLVLICSFALVFFYSRQNCRLNNYCGFSRISEINLIGQILYFNLPVEAGHDSKLYYNCLLNWRTAKKDPMPYYFLEFCDSRIWENNSRFKELGEFNRKVIASNLPIFVLSSLGNIPHVILEQNEVIPASPKSDNYYLNGLFQFLYQVYLRSKYFNLIALPAFPLVLFFFLKKNSLFLAFLATLGSIVMSQIVTSAFFQYSSYGRLISPIEPELYLFSFLSLGFLLKNIKTLLK